MQATAIGQPPTKLTTAASPRSITVDAADVYWTDFGSNGNKQVHAMALSRGSIIDLDMQGSSATSLVVDATYVYRVAPGASTIDRAPLAGGATTDLIDTGSAVANAIVLGGGLVVFAAGDVGASVATRVESFKL